MPKAVLFLLFPFLFACCETPTSQPVQPPISLKGSWEYQGFGKAINIGDSIINRYHLSTVGNLPMSDVTVENFLDYYTIDTLSKDSIHLKDGVKTFVLKRSNMDYSQNINEELANDPLYNFEILWNTFNEQYCYFKERNIDWKSVYQKYQPKINSLTKPLELYLLFEKMLEEIDDGHISIDLPEELEEAYQAQQIQIKEPQPDEEETNKLEKEIKHLLVEKYIDQVNYFNRQEFKWGMVNQDICYIQVQNMIGLAHYEIPDSLSNDEFWDIWWQKLNAAKNYHDDVGDGTRYIMDSIVNSLDDGVAACIIDLRFNGGGFDDASVEFLNTFANKKTDFCSKKVRHGKGFTEKLMMSLSPARKRFEGKLYVLTSHQTASAAELLVLGSKVIPNAMTIGSTTEGIFSDILHKKLPNGWTYGLSNMVYESLAGLSYENIGLAPDHALDYPKARKAFFKYLLKDIENGDDAIEFVIEDVQAKNK